MSHKIQLDLFTKEDEKSLLRKEIQALLQEQGRIKRHLSKRYQELSRFCLQLKEENEQLKCRLDRLENALNQQSQSPNDDLLEKLFKEAYLL